MEHAATTTIKRIRDEARTLGPRHDWTNLQANYDLASAKVHAAGWHEA